MKLSTRRRLAYGSNATLVTVMVVLVLALVYVLADAYQKRWDLSAEGSNTLQPDTLSKLALLDRDGIPVEITAFTNQRGKEDSYFKNRSMKDLLEEIDRQSQAVTWRQVDFDKERLTAEKLGITMYGHVVVQRGSDRVDIKDRELFHRAGKGKDKRIDFSGEAALGRALAQLMTPRRRVVYATTGHGELDPEEKGPDGLSELVAALDGERYDTEKLDLLRTGREGEVPKIPDDAAVVFIARPRTALAPQEEDILLDYLGRGGPLLFAIDVGDPVSPLLHRMGVSVPDGVALDKRLLFPYRDRPVPRYKRHPVTEQLIESELVTVLAQPAPLQLADPPADGVKYAKVLETSREGWIERGGQLEGGAAIYEPGIDGEGPVTMAAAIELHPGKGIVRTSKRTARVLVVGDGDAFTNGVMAEGPGNGVFAVDAIHWLAGEDTRLGAGVARSAKVRRLALTEEETGTLRWLSMGVMPLVVLGAGIFNWFLRRGR